MRKASKRLINAIIALVASVILCIGVCLAWFAMNDEVTGEGMQTQIKSGDIVSFNVTAYYLDYSSSNNNYKVVAGDSELIKDANGTKLTIDHNGDKIINSLTSTGTTGDMDVMRPYSVNGGYTTAVLFKVEYEIVDGSSKKFRIFAECDEDSRLKVTEVSKDKFKSYLSNTVTFVSATQSATANGSSTFAEGDDTTPNYTYTAGETNTAFVGGVGLREKSFNINLSDGITTASLGEEKKNSNGNYENTEYFIMDYEKERFTYISSLLLESGGGLNSSLTLTGDVVLGIEEYTEGETVTPTAINVDTLAYNYSTAYKQSMGADIMTPNWQFVVTYSDGTKKVIVGTNSNLNITGVTTTTVGPGTATATYTEGTADPISCSVPYTIGLAITGGSGVAKNNTLQLSATGLGEDVAVTWSSSDTNIATVSDKGVVTGVAEGTVTITATAAGYDKDDASTHYLKAEYTITVTPANIPVTGVSLNTDTLTLGVGNKGSLLATVAPTNATNRAVTWTSSDSTVATVVDGVVTALKTGTVTITVTTQGKGADGTTTYSAQCKVTVKTTVPVTSVTIEGTASEIAVGGTTTLTATVLPETATDSTVTWSSSDERVATVDGGTVKGISAGTVTITATAGDKSDSYEITVTGVKLDKTSATLTYGVDASLKLTATAYTTAESYSFSWASSDTSNAIVSISSDSNVCTVTPVATSETAVTITVTLTIGEDTYTATCTITVVAKTYTVTFYDDDGTTVISSSTLEEGTAISKPATNPSKAATAEYTYEFDGWYDAKTGGNEITNFGTVSDSAILSYYARYTATKNKYTVTFNMNGHGTQITAQEVEYGSKLASFTEPTAEGYTFGGWYTDSSLKNAFNVSTDTITDKTTLYAKWTSTSTSSNVAIFARDSSNKALDLPAGFSLTGTKSNYDDGATFTYGGTTYSDPLKLESGTQVTVTLSAKMKVTIVTSKSGNIKIDGTSQTSTGTLELTWDAGSTHTIEKGDSMNLYYIELTPVSGEATQEYTVTFNMNGHGTQIADVETVDGKISAPTEPTATGYAFKGWYKEADCTNAFDFNTAITENTTLYAKWVQTFTVTFKNGDTQLQQTQVEYNSTVSKPTDPEKTGYTFVQWCSDAELTTEFVFTTAITSDTTIYAKWTAIEYSITYMDGETELTGLEPATYTIEDAVNLPTPEKSGYTFDGWYTDAEFTSSKVETIATGTTGAKTFYAKWTSTSVEYTTGTHTLTFAADADIFTVTKASSDGGYGTASDGTARVKLGTNDYLYITMTLKEGDKIYLSGVARPSDNTRVAKLNISCITGTVTGIGSDVEYSGTGGLISETIKVSTAGTIKLQFMRSSTATGCEITNLYVGINEAPTVPVDSVTLSDTTATMQVGGETLTLTSAIAPLNASNTAVSWSSSDETVATVANGVVTALKAGTATITVTTEDGSKTAECVVTVEEATPTVDKVTITAADNATTVATGGTLQLSAVVTGTNNPAQTVTWSIKSGATATGASVSDSGLLTAGTVAGSVTIVATSTVDNTKSDEITIEVVVPVTSVSLDYATATLQVGGTQTLNVTFNPTNATNKNVTWSTSDDTVATVANGVVTALKAGTATITVTTEDGSKTATCVVTVEAAGTKTTHSFTASDLTEDSGTISYDCISITRATSGKVFTAKSFTGSSDDVSWDTLIYTADGTDSIVVKTSKLAKITIYCIPCNSGGTSREAGSMSASVSSGSTLGDIKVDGTVNSSFTKSDNVVTVEATLIANGTCTISAGKRMGVLAIIIEA